VDTSGLGSGLLTVQAIVETFGGDAYIENNSPEGTTIVLSLPLV
jgi:signal transduction histidine kinase